MTRHRRPFGLRDRRLRGAEAFSAVFRFRRVLRGDCVDLHLRPNGLDHARLGLVVPRRALALAVRRNRCKRLLREVFRLNQQDVAGLDLVARVKKDCADDRLRAEFSRLLQRARADMTPDPNCRADSSWTPNA
ncbi:MAG: ribonuclease P protein component [Thiobacillaceae bacterium]|nr:ribonuclease P protein component [Thiobacillaceae bacterium]